MSQTDLMDLLHATYQRAPKVTPLGSTFNKALDGERLGKQMSKVWELMRDGRERSLAEISAAVGSPEASVSARLRDIRRSGHKVARRRVADSGLWLYRVEVAP